ncbi:MAG: MFS transporter [Pirellulaceae bacterium]|nr:MFS transporter [Pirellulaceae bacterium]
MLEASEVSVPDAGTPPVAHPPVPAPPTSGFSGQQWGLLLVLAAVYFTHILDFVIVMPLGDQLRQQLKITPRQFGAVVSAYGIAAMFVGIASSAVVDLFDRKKVLVSAFGGFTLATFYCGLAPDYTHLLIARCLTGIFGGLAASSVMAVIGDVFPDRQRGKAIGVVTSSFAVASTIGLPIGLWLAIQAGNWNAPFIAIGILAVCVLILAAICLPSLTGHRTGVANSPFVQFATVIKHPDHLWSFLFMLSTILGTFIIVPYIAPYLQANCGRSASDLPIVYSIAGVCTLVSMNIVGWATDRFGAKPVFFVCAGGAVVMTLVITNLPPVPVLGAVAMTSLFMVLASGRMIPAQTMMLRASDPALRGAFMNLNTAVSHFATAVGPLITGSILDEEYPGGPLTGFSIAGFVGAAFGCAAIFLSFQLRPFKGH